MPPIAAPVGAAVTAAAKMSSPSSLLTQMVMKTSLTKDTPKELSRSLRWQKAFSSCKNVGVVSPISMSQEEKLSRYTNFSLEHIYEKYRGLQTHLIVRESVLFCSAHDNPELLDPHISRMQTIWMDISAEAKAKVAAAANTTTTSLSVLEILPKSCTNANAFVEKHSA
eukprot:GHVS01056270.1.p1 GENE.GHVS01056270.1~~GHVS01056270.1.p1  ORF type:complete len:168 (+),score=33.73 GHVS01056270.1:278-781(+)